jgi:hypothetical protein
MKKYIFAIFVGFYSIMATAQTNNKNTDIFVAANPTNSPNFLEEYKRLHLGVISETRSNLLVIYLSESDDVYHWAKEFYSNKHIYFGFALTTNKVSVLVVLKPEYGFRISAVTENGMPVEPTSEGAKYGRSFNDLKGFDKQAIDPTRNKPHYSYMPHFDIVGPTSDAPRFDKIATPDELFTFQKPGKYTITIETACFLKDDYMPHINSNTTNYYLVKSPPPPVKLTVIKKEDEK